MDKKRGNDVKLIKLLKKTIFLEIFREEKENVEEIEEKKTVIQKPLPVSNEKEQRKSLTHAKRNSACMKIMTSKENEQVIETPKLYESLIRGGKQSLLENKSNERK